MRIKPMKNLTISCAAMAILAGIAVAASAGEHTVSVPKSTLASMGFANARQLSDSDGLAVRGKGTSSANYFARNGNATWTNPFTGSGSHHSNAPSAPGSSLSFGGNVSGSIHHGHFNVIFAGGNASASAH
jgi:hypothetical protein